MRLKTVCLTLVLLVCFSFFISGISNAAKFQVLKPAKINIPRKIKKIFIDPKMINDTNDKFNLKYQVIETLKRRINSLGRFQVTIGPAAGFDPNSETVAVIQGDVISGGEIDYGQLTEKAVCRGGLSGLVGAAREASSSQQGITFSRRGMLCKLPSLTTQLLEKGITAGLSLFGLQENPRIDEVIRVYKYKNFSIFTQVNLSLTQIGQQRETLAIRSDAASFSRHVVNPGSFHNVRESGDNALVIWLWFHLTPIAPVINRRIGIVDTSNPGSFRGKWYEFMAPGPADLPKQERKEIIAKIVDKTLEQFITSISPYRATIDTEMASGGNPAAKTKIEEGKFKQVIEILKDATAADDLYNLGLAYEAGAATVEDYEDAMRYYSQALDKEPGTRLFAQGIGRMEYQLRIYKKLQNQLQK